MSDKIYIQDLLLRCIIGINEWERKQRQDVIINVTLITDLTQPGKTDNIDDAVNYRDVTKKIVELVEKSNYYLLEKLASAIAEFILDNFNVLTVNVRIDKPGALRFARSVAVEITRSK